MMICWKRRWRMSLGDWMARGSMMIGKDDQRRRRRMASCLTNGEWRAFHLIQTRKCLHRAPPILHAWAILHLQASPSPEHRFLRDRRSAHCEPLVCMRYRVSAHLLVRRDRYRQKTNPMMTRANAAPITIPDTAPFERDWLTAALPEAV